MSDRDDLRFGDVGGGQGRGDPAQLPWPLNWLVQAIIFVIFLYVLLAVIDSLFISLPFV